MGALQAAAGLRHWVTENAKTTRAFLKRVAEVAPLAVPIQEQDIQVLPRPPKGGQKKPGSGNDQAIRALLAPALAGQDVGLMSEAGLPAVADPGSALVLAAHKAGIEVVPFSGPSSLVLALAASGLHGQSFAFVGYLPVEPAARTTRIRELEALSRRAGQTQLVIETPYRNTALLQALMQTLHPHTRLAVCCAMSLPQQVSRSALVSEWKRSPGIANELPLDTPAVFLFGR